MLLSWGLVGARHGPTTTLQEKSEPEVENPKTMPKTKWDFSRLHRTALPLANLPFVCPFQEDSPLVAEDGWDEGRLLGP